MNDSLEAKPEVNAADENLKLAIENMRKQLRLEKKNVLIEQWMGMYATLIKQEKMIHDLKVQLKQQTESSDSVTNEASASEELKDA